MSLRDILSLGVSIANTQTASIQSTVLYSRNLGSSGSGEPILAGAVPLQATVDWRQQQVRTLNGLLTVSRAAITFLDIDALLAATNGAGVDEADVIVLPDGSTGMILDMAGYVDPKHGIPFATTVYLG